MSKVIFETQEDTVHIDSIVAGGLYVVVKRPVLGTYFMITENESSGDIELTSVQTLNTYDLVIAGVSYSGDTNQLLKDLDVLEWEIWAFDSRKEFYKFLSEIEEFPCGDMVWVTKYHDYRGRVRASITEEVIRDEDGNATKVNFNVDITLNPKKNITKFIPDVSDFNTAVHIIKHELGA